MNKFYVIIYHPSRFVSILYLNILIFRYLNSVIDTSKTEISITLSITIWGYPSRYSHYTLPDTAYHCWNISLRCISIINNVGTHLLLRRDVQDTASGRTRCYVGTQFREHQKRLSIAIFMAIYGRLWQFFYEKKHKSIIIKKRGCTMNRWYTLLKQLTISLNL